MDITYNRLLRRSVNLVLLICLAVAGTARTETSGGIKLRWTAPGDDGFIGTATGYNIRYQPASKGRLDTEAEWRTATRVSNVPFPSPAYSRDSAIVVGLTIGATYYFALRTYDEVGNYSALSNSPLIVAVATECCTGRVGDVNGVGGDEPTISDVAMLIDHLFMTNQPVWCAGEADVNQSGGSTPQQGSETDISMGDVSALVDYLFVSGTPLPTCY